MSCLYAINAETDNPIFLINEHIGYDEDVTDENGNILSKGDGQGIDGRQFAREFFEIDNRRPALITYYNNSTGGDVKQGLDIYTAILEAKSKTLSIIAGFAYSTDGWIALAANKVKMYDFASWMCHCPYDPKNPELKTPFAEMVENKIATIIAAKSGKNGFPKKTPEYVKKMMAEKTYMTAEQMYKEGFIDEVITAENTNVVSYDNIKNQHKEYQSLVNKIILKDKKTINKNNMYEQLTNRLKLAPNSSEADILSAIAGFENKINLLNNEKVEMQNKINVANAEKIDLQKRLEEAQSSIKNKEQELTVLKNNYDTMKNEMDSMDVENKSMKEKIDLQNKEKDALELKNKEDKANALIQKHIDAGRIKNEVKLVNAWKNQAIENYDLAEAQLEAIPITMKTPIPSALKNDADSPSFGTGSDDEFRRYNQKLREERAKR